MQRKEIILEGIHLRPMSGARQTKGLEPLVPTTNDGRVYSTKPQHVPQLELRGTHSRKMRKPGISRTLHGNVQRTNQEARLDGLQTKHLDTIFFTRMQQAFQN